MNTIDEIFIIDFSIQLSLTKLTKIYKLSYKKKKKEQGINLRWDNEQSVGQKCV